MMNNCNLHAVQESETMLVRGIVISCGKSTTRSRETLRDDRSFETSGEVFYDGGWSFLSRLISSQAGQHAENQRDGRLDRFVLVRRAYILDLRGR